MSSNTANNKKQNHLEYRVFPEPHWRLTPGNSAIHSEILLVHGLGEHAGRMLSVASFLANQGFAVRILDLPGHGGDGSESHHRLMRAYLTEGGPAEVLHAIRNLSAADQQHLHHVRDEKNLQLNSTCFQSCVETVERCMLWSAADGNESRRPHFVWAHSMGGLAAILALGNIDRDLSSAPNGAVLTSPALAPPPFKDDLLTRILTAKAQFISGFLPLKPFAMLQRGAMRALDLKSDSRWASDHVSDLEDEKIIHQEDPLQHLFLPLCFVARLLPAMSRAHSQAKNLRTPTFSIVPGFDPIVDTHGLLKWSTRLKSSFDKNRPHRVQKYEDLCVHDVPRSSISKEAMERAGGWLLGAEPI